MQIALLVGLSVGGCTNDRIKDKLANIEGVTGITDYLVHEGTIEATVLLGNERSIWIYNLREGQFADTDQIYVVKIGNIVIDCGYPGQGGHTSSGHNIIAIASSLARGTISSASIRSIPQLVHNYDSIMALVESLPVRGEPGARVTFSHRTPSQWYCYKIVTSG